MTITLTLDRKLDYRVIGPLSDELRSAQGGDIILDATNTVQIGAQAIQILLSAAKSCMQANANLRLQNVSSIVEGQLALLGFRIADIEAGGDADARAWA